jgi:pimeloyl-ACP methyl ester carboxylesterase
MAVLSRGSLPGVLDAAGCGRAVVQGFSNGAAAAGKLYCRGETFGGSVLGYLLDDPVPDGGVVGCRPPAGVQVRLYSTGGLAVATDGWSCASQDWTCEGGRTIGIDRYARELGTTVAPSIHRTHAEYTDPPDVAAWLE